MHPHIQGVYEGIIDEGEYSFIGTGDGAKCVDAIKKVMKTIYIYIHIYICTYILYVFIYIYIYIHI
jgi:hypothetical protein